MPNQNNVADTKQLRKDLDDVLSRLRTLNGNPPPNYPAAASDRIHASRERSLATTKLQEAIMWLGMDLKAMHEAGVEGTENPYPSSYDPSSPKIEPTSDGLRL